MSTAVASPPLAAPAASLPDIWEGANLQVIGLTGEKGHGKTLFGLTIDPKRTLFYDNEGSAAQYLNLLREPDGSLHRYVDVARELMAAYPTGAKPKERFLWWLGDVRKRIQPGRYSVVMVDPISEIENGLAQYVWDNPNVFGYTLAQFQNSSGLYWGAVKDYWKSILDDIRVRCSTFVFTAHMRNKYRGNKPSGEREAKGKETLFELASLYLQVERMPNDKGEVQAQPSAIVLKSRLSHVGFDAAGNPTVQPILPPRLPVASPAAIREYIRKPANYGKLAKGEKIPEHVLSEEEKLHLQLEVATATRDAEQAQLSRLERMQQAAAADAAKRSGITPAPDQTAQMAQAAQDKAQAMAAEHQQSSQSEYVAQVSPNQLDTIKQLVPVAFASPSEFASTLKHYGRSRAGELTQNEAAEVIDSLQRRMANRAAQASVANGNGNGHAPEQPKPAAPQVEMASPAQLDAIKAAAQNASVDQFKLAAILKPYGVGRFSELTRVQADEVICLLNDSIQPSRATPEQLAEIKTFINQMQLDSATLYGMLSAQGVGKFSELSVAQAGQVIVAFQDMALKSAAIDAAPAATEPSPAAAATTPAVAPQATREPPPESPTPILRCFSEAELVEARQKNGGSIVPFQLEMLKNGFQSLGIDYAGQQAFASEYRISSFRSLTVDDADELIGKLIKIWTERKAPKN